MEISAATAVYLHLLDLDADRGGDVATSLTRLALDLVRVVPSLLAVSLAVDRLGHDIAVTALVPTATRSTAASSLAVPLVSGDDGAALLLHAGQPGAFLLVADDLAGLLGAAHPLEVDRHLRIQLATAASAAETLAELQLVNQAIGVLMDRGATGSEAALADLRRRAATTGSTIGAVSRRLLADLHSPPDAIEP